MVFIFFASYSLLSLWLGMRLNSDKDRNDRERIGEIQALSQD